MTMNNMSLSFALKYKPCFIDDFCIETHLKSTLHSLIELDDLNVLFIGTQSSGKTSLLNAIIREYYHLNKTQHFSEKNVLFINNLKEQGIGFFRNDMKTFCQSHSLIQGKKKIIVIDDMDTINEHSQQVFRNYMDKYKHNVHFISVCTNTQKIIENIQSRLHIVYINPPTKKQIQEFTNNIIVNEDIIMDDESIEFLMKYSKDSIRSIINNLEKIHIYNKPVNLALCKKLLTDISFDKFETYITCLKEKQLFGAIQILYEIYDHGYSVIDIFEYFYSFVKITKVIENENQKYKIIQCLCKYITIFHSIHENIIELSLFTNDIFPFFDDD